MKSSGRRASPDPEGKGELTPFQTISTVLAGTVGSGNIAGVSAAIAIGGPGAVFWMWIIAIVGMMTKMAEVTLSVGFIVLPNMIALITLSPKFFKLFKEYKS